MLDDYLETNIQNKLNLLSILGAYNPIPYKELSNRLKLSLPSTNNLISELNEDLNGCGEITRHSATIYFSTYENFNIFQLFRSICSSSSVLQCLKFMILNDKNRPFSDFIEKEYLAKSSAYRIRHNCCEYIRSIGLNTKDNHVIGEEYRIRFLIALLHYKYGIDCYTLDDTSLRIIRNFILSTNNVIDLTYLENTSHEYGYFEYLIFLSWKRKKYNLSSAVSKRLTAFKELFIYDKLKNALLHKIEHVLGIKFTQEDYDYVYLVYFCTSHCLFSDQWTDKRAKHLHRLAFSDPFFSNLLSHFECELGTEIVSAPAFRTTLIYFYKKCFLELYCIIPDTNFFIHPKKGKLILAAEKLLSNIFNDWQKVNNLKYAIDKHHVTYLSLQIEFILRQYTSPVNLIILSDLNADLQVLNLYFKRNFSSDKIKIIPFLLNSNKKDFLLSQKNSIIVVHKKFESAAYSLGLDKHNIIIPITVEVNDEAIHSIQKALAYYEQQQFLQFIERN